VIGHGGPFTPLKVCDAWGELGCWAHPEPASNAIAAVQRILFRFMTRPPGDTSIGAREPHGPRGLGDPESREVIRQEKSRNGPPP
jgi:hypothetical protein